MILNSHRTNVHIQGISDTGAGEDAHAKELEVINEKMKMQPPLLDLDVERCYRPGCQTDPACPNSTQNAHATLQPDCRASPSNFYERRPYPATFTHGIPNTDRLLDP